MSNEEILHIYVEIATGRGRHGGFLVSFAEALTRADPSNFDLVRPTALQLIAKYERGKYLDNFVMNHRAVDGIL